MTDDQSSSPKNYTPLPITKSTHGENKVLTFLVLNLVAFLSAASLVGVVGIQRQIALKQNVTSTKASNQTKLCAPHDVENPKTVKAYMTLGKIDTEIENGATVSASAIKFIWEPVNNAKSYYAVLSKKSAQVDPAVEGKELIDTNFSVAPLDKSTTYYLFLRSKNSKNILGFVFPTPGNCYYVKAAESIFTFSTK